MPIETNTPSFLLADWPAPKQINAFTTTRLGGASQTPPFNSFNMSLSCGDKTVDVLTNHAMLHNQFNSEHELEWLKQVHGANAVHFTKHISNHPPHEADACITRQQNKPCIVMTADCLPILLCNQSGTEIAAIHGGWRSLQQGIIAHTISQMDSNPKALMAWLGPAIGPDAFEVGIEVFDAFQRSHPYTESAFHHHKANHCMADIFQLGRLLLQNSGVSELYGGGVCTVNNPDLFYSYRRDQGKTGRMASCIWIDPSVVI